VSPGLATNEGARRYATGNCFAAVGRMRLLLQVLLMVMTGSVMARPRALVVTATAGYRHESIPTAESILELIGNEQNVEVAFVRTEEEVALQLTRSRLRTVRAVLFVNTTGDLPLGAAEALVAWVRDGGVFVGIHSASDTWHSVPDYMEMIGGEFIGHPAETSATVIVDDATHVATRTLPAAYALYEEFYYLGSVDLTAIRALLSIRKRPEPPAEDGYWPLAWEKSFGRGRVLYTALGHREDVWLSDWFRAHLTGIVRWAVTPPAYGRRRAVRH